MSSSDKFRLGLEVRGDNNEAPAIANIQHLCVEVTAPYDSEHGKKPALDLVAVLDVSGSMREHHKLQNLKSAMNYVIKKLGAGDRLAIIPFTGAVEKHQYKLAHMTQGAKHKAASFVHGLEAHGATNMRAGLHAGLKVLHDRAHKDGRAAAIFLLSDGMQNQGGDARTLDGIGHVTVDTFGFGVDHGPKVLEDIATKSLGGTYNFVLDNQGDTLTKSFSQPLAGLRTVVFLDLKLTLCRGESTIHNVYAGSYPREKNPNDGSVTVHFGHLYRDETRKVLVVLQLPAVHHDHTATVMTTKCVYSIPGHGKITKSILSFMDRKGRLDGYPIHKGIQVSIEEVRRDHVDSIRKIMHAANNKELHHARAMLTGALNALKEIHHKDKYMADSLTAELEHFRRHMVSQHEYNKHGHAYALASISSHERQRFTARGHVDHIRLFATTRMDKYLEQAINFHKDPNHHI